MANAKKEGMDVWSVTSGKTSYLGQCYSDGRKEWCCRFCSETNVWTRWRCRRCQTSSVAREVQAGSFSKGQTVLIGFVLIKWRRTTFVGNSAQNCRNYVKRLSGTRVQRRSRERSANLRLRKAVWKKMGRWKWMKKLVARRNWISSVRSARTASRLQEIYVCAAGHSGQAQRNVAAGEAESSLAGSIRKGLNNYKVYKIKMKQCQKGVGKWAGADA